MLFPPHCINNGDGGLEKLHNNYHVCNDFNLLQFVYISSRLFKAIKGCKNHRCTACKQEPYHVRLSGNILNSVEKFM